MDREKLPGTSLYVRNFGSGRSRITVIEPESVEDYQPERIPGCNVILLNSAVRRELARYYDRSKSRHTRNKDFPGGVSSTADLALKKYLNIGS